MDIRVKSYESLKNTPMVNRMIYSSYNNKYSIYRDEYIEEFINEN